MGFRDMCNYVTEPLDASHLTMLRNCVICGVAILALTLIGLKNLVTLSLYLVMTSVIVLVSWLYCLESKVRTQVQKRICDVVRTFVKYCVGESIGEQDESYKCEMKPAEKKKDDDAEFHELFE